MTENRLTLSQLSQQLQQRAKYQHERNLILVAFPLATAHQEAKTLARSLGADYLDFDCELLAQFEADDWADHVQLERKNTLSIGQMVARTWLSQVAQRINRQKPLVVGNINLAVRYELDVAQALYDATANGMCIIAAGGRVQSQTLLIHGVLPQTGASSPAYEVVRPPDDRSPGRPQPVQDRLL